MKGILSGFVTALLFCSLLLPFSGKAQTDDGEAIDTTAIQKATEFNIPASGAFTLLGGKPSEVTTPGFTKDIKLDYFVNKFSLNPNIAFDFQPVWLFGFKNMSWSDYRRTSAVARFLSTANISLGTRQDNDSIHHLAYSLKFTIQSKDPLHDKDYRDGIRNVLSEILKNREAAELPLSMAIMKKTNQIKRLDKEADAESIRMLNKSIDSLANKMNALLDVSQEELEKAVKEYAEQYIAKNRQRFKMDVGVGQLNTYQNAELPKLGMNKQGIGLWLNPSWGFTPAKVFDKNNQKNTDKVIFSGLIKYIKTDSVNLQYYGGNIRYGTSHIDLFAEYIYVNNAGILAQTIAYGGSYKLGSNKLIEFGLRTNYDKDFNFSSMTPVISFNWKLAPDLLK